MRIGTTTTADLLLGAYEWVARRAFIAAGTRRAARFGSFGSGSIICFPPVALFGEHAIHIGSNTLIGPHCALSAGMAPGQSLLSDRVVVIGDRCLIGRHSSIAGHLEVVIEDDVYFGPNVFVTDQNHAVTDPYLPIGRQSQPEAPVRIGAGSWLGTNVVVVPGVTIGRHVAVGANSVVTTDLPDNCVAVGAPARPIDRI
ncbi:MAG: acyltransferase [Actinomycetota bacterium]|nr:acyltransferase [Actinomycetota bacterium]